MDRIYKIYTVYVISLLFLPFVCAAQTVSNVTARQEGNTVVVSYSLDGDADISVCCSTDGGKTFSPALTSVRGDVGPGVKAGDRSLVWDVLGDVDRLVTTDLVFMVVPGGMDMTFIANGVPFKMIYVKGGSFEMGATKEQAKAAAKNEYPVHKVTLSGFHIGQTEVTQALWEAVMGTNPSTNKAAGCPVETVSWDECQLFIKKLNKLLEKQLYGRRLALPTEAQWEYAARGGEDAPRQKFSGGSSAGNVCWNASDSKGTTHPVMGKQPNRLGLYDMSGNVWEYCSDRYGTYSASGQENPGGASSGMYRVRRGGSFSSESSDCRVSKRVS
ncbi:MAG: formylglycine-generating enzyme family protein, partial [Candidatus Cryptobacteroides sp.]